MTREAEIAVVGLACHYPDARSPRELWENVLARRQAFRRFRPERMPAAYHSDDPSAEDRTYGRLGAFLDGFVFDCAARRIPRSTYAATDLSHWLALEVATRALDDAGVPQGRGLAGDRTAVIVGNSLTGEFSRANSMRLRWPFVERVLHEAAREQGIPLADIAPLIAATGERFRSYFPATSEDTLAGALSNTIAGRICGVFDFGGGGYVVDGACASSLLAVCTAASALEERRVDAVVAGGVDISMDPFELVGFAKAKALSPTRMRVYDRRGNGFVPGEGCAFVVLQRLADARAAGRPVYAILRGWGVSSDGRNAITAPKVEGQARAIRQAWARAGVPTFVEGHGTGTALGDRVELEAIASVAAEHAGEGAGRIGVTSLKSILGHTKAAAGIGAFLKAVMAVNRRVLPPTSDCVEPNAVFEGPARSLYPIVRGRVCEPGSSLRAGASAMGFGGINAHVVVESGDAPDARLAPTRPEVELLASGQDSELFVLAADSHVELDRRLESLRRDAIDLARGELPDLSAALIERLPARAKVRAAIVAETPAQLVERIDRLRAAGPVELRGPELWLGEPTRAPKLAFVCPGQGSQDIDMARWIVERDPALREALHALARPELLAALHPELDPTDVEARRAARERLSATELAQPALCLVTLAWARKLAALGLRPDLVAGHSLGELSALALAGAYDEPTLMRLATRRGQLMAVPSERPAGMTSLTCDRARAESLLAGLPGHASIANVNAPRQVVVAGERAALDELEARAARAQVAARRLAVSNGFHSPLVARAAAALSDAAWIPAQPLELRVPLVSTLAPVDARTDLRRHVGEHARAEVDWQRVVEQLAAQADLIVEVGAGRVLSGLVEAIVGSQGVRCLPVEGVAGRVADFHAVLAGAWVLGAELRWAALHEHRFVRPLVLASQRSFIVNPCEAGVETRELVQPEPTSSPSPSPRELAAERAPTPTTRPTRSPLDQLVAAVAARTGFEPASIEPSARLREDLNLDSIKAGEIIASVALAFGVAERIDPAQLSNHPLADIAAALREAGAGELATPSVDANPTPPSVVAHQPALRDPAHRWVRSFALALAPAPPAQPPRSDARIRVIAHDPRLAAALRDAGATLDAAQPDTLIVAPEGEVAEQVELLASAIAAIGPSVRALVFVQRTGGRFGVAPVLPGALERPLVGVDAFARSLSLERPQLAVSVVDLARELSPASLLAELPTRPGFVALGLDGHARWTLVADPLALPPEPGPIDLRPGELVLVTGGARGITAACALALARATKVRLALIGSTPRDAVDDEVLHTLGRLALEGIEARYWSCDLADPLAVARLVECVQAEQGPIAALVHGAGRNQPRRVEQVDAAAALHELAPKLLGMQALLRALDASPPRHVVALTSIIGVSGMQGNAWYAYANAMLDLELARFLARHPDTRGRSLAYGVWDEIGMGAKLGSVGVLAKRGIGALAPNEGTQRFLALLAAPALPRQIVVTAHVDDLPTWPALPLDDATLRFLDGERRGVPGVDARIVLALHPERDVYLRDHCFGGSLLFPTVYGLEAMAQVAWAALGTSGMHTRVIEIRDIQLPAPIVVAEQGSTIASHAIVRERADAREPFVVDAEIRCESTGMARAHFRATFEFGDAREPVAARFPSLPAPARPLVPTRDLYGGLLFQGPMFQRMAAIEGAIDHAMILSAEVREPSGPHERWLLGDPHVRDVLLQSGQVLIPRDDALPVAIDRITLARGHEQRGARRVWTTIDRSDARSHFGTVRVIDAQGRELERIEGYEVRVLAHHHDRPDFAAIVSGEGDEARVRGVVEAACRSRGLEPPKLALAAMDLHGLLPERRRALLRPLIHELEPQLEPRWDGEGRPSFGPDARGLSIAHDELAALVVTSERAIGCDLECVRPREATLLGPELRALLPALRAAGDDEATAITRAWSVGEALYKLRGRTELASLRVVTREGGLVELAHADTTILSFALALARGPRRVLALALPRERAPEPTEPIESEPEILRVRMHRDAHADRMETRFVVAFDESGSLAGKLPAYVLATYMGRLRELALTKLATPLRACLASGVHGMVTEAAGVALEGELEALDRVEAHSWVEDLQSGSCTLRFAFHRVDAQGRLERVGEAHQRFGWVEVLGHGHIRAAAFPAFLREFLSSLRHEGSRPQPPALLVPRTPPLRSTAFSTGLLDGNVVGNLYFAHAFKWPWRVLEQLLHDVKPELFRSRGRAGELLVTGQRVEYLREAMPFDTVEVALHVERLVGSELVLAVESRRREARGEPTRLSLARIDARWVVRDEQGRAHPAALPSDLLHLFTPTSTPTSTP